VNQLARFFRTTPVESGPGAPAGQGSPARRVAIIAVDPSSPFTGGAILGDRVRMRDLAGDPGVFIRSMATRGSLGGLAAATAGLVQALDAAGFELILIETVGAGQAEVDIARLAHTTLVVEAPGLGDEIQAIKAGILEIADLLVINKADRPGVENTERALRSMLQLAHPVRGEIQPAGPASVGHHRELRAAPAGDGQAGENRGPEAELWIPPVLKTVATEGIGIPALAQAILDHRRYLEASGEWRRRERTRLKSELEARIQEALVRRWQAGISEADFQAALNGLLHRELTPPQAVEQLTRHL
jgi:LAO/AO transport system kinase